MLSALSSLAASLVGTQVNRPRKSAKPTADDPSPTNRRRAADGFESQTEPTQAIDPARAVGENTGEQAAEDHLEHPAYNRGGTRRGPRGSGSIDLSA